MTKLTKKEYIKLTTPTPNPVWAILGTLLGLMFLIIFGLGLVWIIKLLIQAIF